MSHSGSGPRSRRWGRSTARTRSASKRTSPTAAASVRSGSGTCPRRWRRYRWPCQTCPCRPDCAPASSRALSARIVSARRGRHARACCRGSARWRRRGSSARWRGVFSTPGPTSSGSGRPSPGFSRISPVSRPSPRSSRAPTRVWSALHGLPGAERAEGFIVWSPERKRGYLVVHNLPALAPGRLYQLWVGGGPRPALAGAFDVDSLGHAALVVTVDVPRLMASQSRSSPSAAPRRPADGSCSRAAPHSHGLTLMSVRTGTLLSPKKPRWRRRGHLLRFGDLRWYTPSADLTGS